MTNRDQITQSLNLAATSANFAPTVSRRLPKRRKTEQACTSCRSLRIRCNGRSPCNNCTNNAIRCDYDGADCATEKLTLARAVKRIAQLEERLRVYERYLTSDTGSHVHISAFQKPAQVLQPEQEEEEDMVQLLRGTTHLSLMTRTPEFYGGSSADAIVSTMESPGQSKSPQTPSDFSWIAMEKELAWQSSSDPSASSSFPQTIAGVMPPKAVADEYTRRYFQTAHRLYPILHYDVFMDRYAKLWAGLPIDTKGCEFRITVSYMVIALGHQCCTVDPDPEVRRVASLSPLGEICFHLAKTELTDVPLSGGDVSAAMGMLLAFIWLYNQQRLHEAYAMLGVAIRVGYATGLHRDVIDPNANPDEVEGWVATWWLLFIYETELSTLSGRPCAIQPKEVDVRQFPLDASPVYLQYVERMRQFSRLTWNAYEQVYSLSLKCLTTNERSKTLVVWDRTLCTWYDSWYPRCSWAKEPHGLIFQFRYYNIRIPLYRAFLKLLVIKSRKQEELKENILFPAGKCVELAMALVQLIKSTDFGGSGILRAAIFQTLCYLWNATITLLLYLTDPFAPVKLNFRYADVEQHVHLAIDFFTAYESAVPFASRVAAEAKRLLNMTTPNNDPQVEHTADTGTDQSGISMQIETSNEVLDFLPGFNFSASDADDSFGGIFGNFFDDVDAADGT